ncbi:hypothetical protein N9X60_00975 [Paracoccaceae bacterium]|nr:hypothetical protein [Paracoccaceae bacterium]
MMISENASPDNDVELITQIQSVLKKHFMQHGADEDQLGQFARTIYDELTEIEAQIAEDGLKLSIASDIDLLAATIDNIRQGITKLDKLHTNEAAPQVEHARLAANKFIEELEQAQLLLNGKLNAGGIDFGSPQTRRGRRPYRDANRVAQIVALQYTAVTGKAPTVSTDSSKPRGRLSGPFIDLLSDVFVLLDLEFATESATKHVVNKRYKKSNSKKN